MATHTPSASIPKVNDKRQVVGKLPYAMDFVLRPPTTRDISTIEQIWNTVELGVDRIVKAFSLLSGISEDELFATDGEAFEVMGKSLDLFPVFRNKT